MSQGLERIIENHDRSIAEPNQVKPDFKYSTYCISNLRGGIGKSTISFNLAYSFSRQHPTLVADLCPQQNLTELLIKDYDTAVTVMDALRPKVLGSAFGDEPDDISYLISQLNDYFKGGKSSYFIPGDSSLFAFPSALYQQLQQAMASGDENATYNILMSLAFILQKEAKDKKCKLTLMDCSPFYAGGTHLAWCASDAIIIPVRVDEHSIDSLEMTLDMLGDPDSDFNIWSKRAGGIDAPRVAAIVMTMVGAQSPIKGVKDLASRLYVERAYEVAAKYPYLFDYEDPADAFAITDDFKSAGRISGALSIPVPRLKVGSFHTIDGKRLQVNQSQEKYSTELGYLTSIL